MKIKESWIPLFDDDLMNEGDHDSGNKRQEGLWTMVAQESGRDNIISHTTPSIVTLEPLATDSTALTPDILCISRPA